MKSDKFFLRLVSPSFVNILDLDNLGRRDFFVDYNFQEMMVSNECFEEGVNFVNNVQSIGVLNCGFVRDTYLSPSSLSEK